MHELIDTYIFNVHTGEDTLDLQNVRVDDRQLTEDEYSILPDGSLRISADTLPKNADFVIETTVRLQPEKNLALSGLYASNGTLSSDYRISVISAYKFPSWILVSYFICHLSS